MPGPLFADIILPLAVRGKYTYSVPERFSSSVYAGARVKAPFGSSAVYTGIVSEVHRRDPGLRSLREIEELVDLKPIVNQVQLKLWEWIASYYLCGEGEVMKAALPLELKLDSFRPRLEAFISLGGKHDDKSLNSLIDSLTKAPKQQAALMAWLRLSGYLPGSVMLPVRKAVLSGDPEVSPSALAALCAKGVFLCSEQEVSRLGQEMYPMIPLRELSNAQSEALASVKEQFINKDIVLLHGITSSGKTEIYIHLIEEQLKQGKQVLYMLPEIALTTQIIERLRRHFGDKTGVYHSRFSDPERAEIWKRIADGGYRLVLGVRSSLFLPFNDLGLVIVDEEHDGSYKQHDPAPRYNARDTAVMLAALHGAKTLLGSASPSVESYNNALNGKYGLTELLIRYGHINLPEIILANTREAYRKKLMVSHFSPELLQAMDDALGREEQIILFRNRRGFSPYIECSECGWIPVCVQCAVNLTYHKAENRLICHHCGYSSFPPPKCGNCGSTGMITRGFGTEKIEDEIKIVFPSARVARMDQDTTRGKNAFNRIIKAFEERRIDILIGTQMISKGLDFENLTVVGILNADNMLNFPDFRAHERSFQLMEQVSGRAGRRQKQGRVVIQTSDPANRIIRLVLRHDYAGMFRLQSEERRTFNYPPFCRMIKITLKHRDRAKLNQYSQVLGDSLKAIFGKRVLGPETPLISQVQAWYLKTIILKIEKEKPPAKAKQYIVDAINRLEKEKGASSVKIAVDVDPY